MSTVPQERCGHLTNLPTELKCAIARYKCILKNHKALSLVSKAWAEVVLPLMWETFTTDLIKNPQRDIRGIAHPASNIINHVRNIKMLDRDMAEHEDDPLPLLLAAIPRGQWRKFESRKGVSYSTLELMLYTHPILQELIIPVSAQSKLLESPWTAGFFHRLSHMHISIETLQDGGFQTLWTQSPRLKCRIAFSTLWTQSPRLKYLLIISPQSSMLHGTHLDAALPSRHQGSEVDTLEPEKLRLTSLDISTVLISTIIPTMLQKIDVFALHRLNFVGTADLQALVDAMSTQYQQGKPSLQKLRICRMGKELSDNLILSFIRFLLSFHGLEELHIHYNDSVKIEVDGIINHGGTLTSLSVFNGGIHRQDSTRCWSAGDLRRVAIACPRLEQLCLNLYEIEPDRPEDDYLSSDPVQQIAPTEFEDALSVIASMRNLQVLRLTNPPNYRKAYCRPGELFRFFRRTLEVGEQRYAFQARADGLMRYLGDRGSNIRLLAFSPVENLAGVQPADKNSDVWPDYFYYRERMKGDRGADICIARPLANWRKEVPHATIMGHR